MVKIIILFPFEFCVRHVLHSMSQSPPPRNNIIIIYARSSPIDKKNTDSAVTAAAAEQTGWSAERGQRGGGGGGGVIVSRRWTGLTIAVNGTYHRRWLGTKRGRVVRAHRKRTMWTRATGAVLLIMFRPGPRVKIILILRLTRPC